MKEFNRIGSTWTCWSQSEQLRRTMKTRRFQADSKYDLTCRDMDLKHGTYKFTSLASQFRRSAQTLEDVYKSFRSSCDEWDQSRWLLSYFTTNASLNKTIRSVDPQFDLRKQTHIALTSLVDNGRMMAWASCLFWYKTRHKQSSARCRWSRRWNSRRFRWWWPDLCWWPTHERMSVFIAAIVHARFGTISTGSSPLTHSSLWGQLSDLKFLCTTTDLHWYIGSQCEYTWSSLA